MPHGTVCNRLRKVVLFEVLRQNKQNLCIQCNKVIDNVDELSIEHIKPWEDVSADLFWDLNNIAFSYHVCNIKSRRVFRKYANKEERLAANRQKYKETEHIYDPIKRREFYLRTGW